MTIWAFLRQALTPKMSYRDAVGRVIAWCVRTGQPVSAVETGASCDARSRLLAYARAYLTGFSGSATGVASGCPAASDGIRLIWNEGLWRS